MRVLVTGVAGFIGSWVAETLLKQGHDVFGVDCFVDYYPRAMKEDNLGPLMEWPSFRFVEEDLAATEMSTLRKWLNEYPFISHQAAQAGVRSSWGLHFEGYIHHNILATQRLLEAAKDVGVARFVYASSSSVYGQAKCLPLREDAPTQPVSPYGVTKLAAEHLVRVYNDNYGVPTVALRYFTVYGPRQRPDMAFHRLIRSLLLDEPFPLFGDGSQSRHFTYVADVVEANLAAFSLDGGSESSPFLGQAINIGGGEKASLNEVIALAEELTGRKARLTPLGWQKGDVACTDADLTRAKEWLGFTPCTPLKEGLPAQIDWAVELLRKEARL